MRARNTCCTYARATPPPPESFDARSAFNPSPPTLRSTRCSSESFLRKPGAHASCSPPTGDVKREGIRPSHLDVRDRVYYNIYMYKKRGYITRERTEIRLKARRRRSPSLTTATDALCVLLSSFRFWVFFFSPFFPT